MQPAAVYASTVLAKPLSLYPRLEESRTAIEKKVRQEHGDKSPREREEIQVRKVTHAWSRMVKQNRAQNWKTYIPLIKIPIWFTMMETIRRMTGTEHGMLSLIAKPLTALKGKENPGLGTMDELIPIEPSLATEGMLWFNNLSIPDPTIILPFALSGIVFTFFSARINNVEVLPGLSMPREQALRTQSWNQWKNRTIKLGAFAIGPATLMFPSAMLLYWFSSTLAALTIGYLWQKLPPIIFIRVRKSPEGNKPHEEKKKSKPQVGKFRPRITQDSSNQKKRRSDTDRQT